MAKVKKAGKRQAKKGAAAPSKKSLFKQATMVGKQAMASAAGVPSGNATTQPAKMPAEPSATRGIPAWMIFLAAGLVLAIALLALSWNSGASLSNAPQLQPVPGIAASSSEPDLSFLQPTKEVTLDFLYADWCPHCQRMQPIVSDVISKLPPDRFAVRYWNEKDRPSNSQTSAAYLFYTRKGYFIGFPTFVINTNVSSAGEMDEGDFLSFVCASFKLPKPPACA